MSGGKIQADSCNYLLLSPSAWATTDLPLADPVRYRSAVLCVPSILQSGEYSVSVHLLEGRVKTR